MLLQVTFARFAVTECLCFAFPRYCFGCDCFAGVQQTVALFTQQHVHLRLVTSGHASSDHSCTCARLASGTLHAF